MLFNSFPFVFFYLPIVFCGYFLIARRSHRLAALWLALASLFFYGWWNPKFVALLLASIVFNYTAGYMIGHASRSRARMLLAAAITADLVLLGVFKYANFFISTLNSVGGHIGLVDIILPLGISFFTFTQIAFLVDVYRGIAKEYDFIHYVLFVTWFPHLIAGPVLHHKQMMPQFALSRTYRPDVTAISAGLTLFALGLFKKVILADHLAGYANPVFDAAGNGADPMLIAAWSGVLAYTLQLYFDFSGYSDMAIGLSKMFNVNLPLNFNSPYKSANIIDFWRRWHMTLSAFLRDYLYISLGGNRKGPARRHVNLFATMLLGGLWHGAGWNFVLWGGLHGLYLIANHAWRWLVGSQGESRSRIRHAGSVLLTFVAVFVAWVPFRATSLEATLSIWKGMVGLNGIALPPSFAARLGGLGADISFTGVFPGLDLRLEEVAAWLLVGLFVVWVLPNTQEVMGMQPRPRSTVIRYPAWLTWSPTWRMGLVTGLLFAISVASFTQNSPFLYFQF